MELLAISVNVFWSLYVIRTVSCCGVPKSVFAFFFIIVIIMNIINLKIMNIMKFIITRIFEQQQFTVLMRKVDCLVFFPPVS